MKAMGGYFELELPLRGEYHSNALRLNSGRNALQYILEARRYDKVYIPSYACQALYQPLKKLGTPHEWYRLNAQWEPDIDYNGIKENEALLYVNYFGIKDPFIEGLAGKGIQLIVDNCQAFYSSPIDGCDTFYSSRKYFGVPDGAYLYLGKLVDVRSLPSDYSSARCAHLLERMDLSPEEGYASFLANEEVINHLDLKNMSTLTRRMLSSIDYTKICTVRRENYSVLHRAFTDRNEFSAPNVDCMKGAPLAYPLLIRDEGLRNRLIQERVFVARYWPDVLEREDEGSLEHDLAKYLLPLPIDQRYGKDEMHFLINLIRRLL